MKHVGLIGSGRIAPFYINVLQDLDDVRLSIAASDYSKSARKLSEVYNLRYFDHAAELINENKYIIVACSTPYILQYVKQADAKNKLILAEKPLFHRLEQNLELNNPENLMIGYNRRFYRSVQVMYNILQNHEQRCTIRMEFPERLANENQDEYFALRSNGVHAIDLASYFVGGICSYEIDSFSNFYERIVRITGNKHNAILSFSLNCKAGSKVWFHDDINTHVLAPVERYCRYTSMKIIEADVAGKQVRSYTPQIDHDSVVDDRIFNYKPGFEAQIKSYLSGSTSASKITLDMCKEYLKIVDSIINYESTR